MKSKTLTNGIISLAFTCLSIQVGDTDNYVGFALGILLFSILETRTQIISQSRLLDIKSSTYKAELEISLHLEEVLGHDYAKGKVNHQLQKLDAEKERSIYKLMNNDFCKEYFENNKGVDRFVQPTLYLRFLFINGIIWSDYHKTFRRSFSFNGFDIVEDPEGIGNNSQPRIFLSIKEGVLQLHWGMIPVEKEVICRFPLYIFGNLPWDIIGIPEYFGRASITPINLDAIHKILKQYDFEAIKISDDNDTDSCRTDLGDLFSSYKNRYMTLKFRELLSDSEI